MGYQPKYLAVDEVARIDDKVLAGVAQAYGARPEHECPDCESHWDRTLEAACTTCGLSVDDLAARLERRAT
jgi:hypothetical protein